MGLGKGKGKINEGEACAYGFAGCCGVYCIVCFFVVGIPMLIGGIILLRFAAGDYDEAYRDSLRQCEFNNRENYFHETYAPDDSDVTDECGSMAEWEDAKDDLYIVGIVLVVLAVIALVIGIVLLVLLLCGLLTIFSRKKKPERVIVANSGMYPVAGSAAYGHSSDIARPVYVTPEGYQFK